MFACFYEKQKLQSAEEPIEMYDLVLPVAFINFALKKKLLCRLPTLSSQLI